MQLASEKIKKEIHELLGNKEWSTMDRYGKIIFTPQAPKDRVEKFRKLQDLISDVDLGVISGEEFDEELDKLYPEEEESTMENEENDIVVEKKS